MNVKPIFIMLICLGGLQACDTPEKRPAEVLSEEEMTTLLVDIYLAEARLSNTPIISDSSYKLYLPFEDSLLKRKGISDSVLHMTRRYYMAHPDELEAVYDSVIDSLSLREQREKQKKGL